MACYGGAYPSYPCYPYGCQFPLYYPVNCYSPCPGLYGGWGGYPCWNACAPTPGCGAYPCWY